VFDNKKCNLPQYISALYSREYTYIALFLRRQKQYETFTYCLGESTTSLLPVSIQTNVLILNGTSGFQSIWRQHCYFITLRCYTGKHVLRKTQKCIN